MSQSNDKFNRVSLKRGELVLNALYKLTGSDSDEIEEEFYRLNPLVNDMHIPKDGIYKIPAIETDKPASEEESLLLWG